MDAPLRVVALDPNAPSWPDDVDRARALVGAPDNPRLFPPHFLKTTFQKLGGRVLLYRESDTVLAVAFLFPRAVHPNGVREFTLRLHWANEADRGRAAELARATEAVLGADQTAWYDPVAPQHYQCNSLAIVDEIDCGAASEAEARSIRALQQSIWGSEADFLYPTDIHSLEFEAGTSLIARVGGVPAAFLFGFHKFGGEPLPLSWAAEHPAALRIESQLLGVLPQFRGRHLGFLLKRLQARQAAEQGVSVINWTVDPLQFANAVLNFSWLKAVAFDFYPDYYPFRNDLSRVAASRLGITWLVDSARVRQGLVQGPGPIPTLDDDPGIPRVHFGAADRGALAHAERVAIQVPTNWTTLQQHEPEAALTLRHATDALFGEWLGFEPGKLILTGVATDADRKYLLAERATPALLSDLGARTRVPADAP